MATVPSLTTLTNNTTADAVPVMANLEAIRLGVNNVETAQIVNGTVLDTDLASPNNAVYRTIFFASGVAALDMAIGGRLLSASGGLITSGSTNLVSGPVNPAMFWIDAADYTVASKTTRLRIRATVGVNGTAPGGNWNFGLYPITIGGAADTLTVTLGTIATGSTVTHSSFTPGAAQTVTGSDFAVPATGWWGLAVGNDATLANNSALMLQAQLQMRHT